MNKALPILFGCLALAATAHAQIGAKGNDGKQPDTPAELLAKYDKDGDGKLDAAELAALTSDDRATLDRHHGHPGRGKGGPGPGGPGRGKGGPGPGGKAELGRGDEVGRGKDAPGRGKGGLGRGDEVGRDKDAPDGKAGLGRKGEGRSDNPGNGKGRPAGKGKAN